MAKVFLRRVWRRHSLAFKNNWLAHSARTSCAAAASLGVADLFSMPEAYWAAITTLIVMQSTLGATWNISKQRLLGTFLGAAAGAAVGTYLELAVAVYGLALFTVGLICRILRLDQSAYRFAGIALTLVMLTSGTEPPWVEGIHRFAEVSLGIVVGLVFSAVWPKTEPPSGQP